MSILNRPSDGTFNVLLVIYKYLLYAGPTPRARLIATCAPKPIGDGARVRQTINTWVKLGVLAAEPKTEMISVAGAYPSHELEARTHSQLVDELTLLVRKAVFRRDNNENFWDAEGAGASDFVRVAAWALAQDPFSMPSGHSAVEELAGAQLESGFNVIGNSTRWNGFAAWATHLGLAWMTAFPPGLMVDPTPAVRDSLQEVFGDAAELRISDFLEGAARALPVLDGGEYRRRVEEKMSGVRWVGAKPHQVSPSFSVSLERLREQGVLRLESRADAPKRTLLGRGWQEGRTVSHVVIEGRK